MKHWIKFMIVSILVAVAVFCIHDTQAEAPIILREECEMKETNEDKAMCYLDKSEVDEKGKKIITNVLRGESSFQNIQSQIKKTDGTYEDSHGIAQIHLPSHPSVSWEQAYDIEFSINFIVDKYIKNQMDLWSVYRKLYGNKQ